MGLFEKAALRVVVVVTQQTHESGQPPPSRRGRLHGGGGPAPLAQTPGRGRAYHPAGSCTLRKIRDFIFSSLAFRVIFFCLKIIILGGGDKEACRACFCFNMRVTERVTHGLGSMVMIIKVFLKQREEEFPLCPSKGPGAAPAQPGKEVPGGSPQRFRQAGALRHGAGALPFTLAARC